MTPVREAAGASADFAELLRREGVIGDGAQLTPLSGGVSCEILLVEDGGVRFIVKRALPKLRVKMDWFADVSRNRHEWEFISYVARFLPGAVPALRHCSSTGNYFAMEHLGGDFRNWKETLLRGEAEFAERAGALIGAIHRNSTGEAVARERFDTTANFFQLRIEPYLLATGARHPTLQPLFEAEAARLAQTRECLVHGDFSPKNILVNAERMVLLDCEVAWYGDPAFDLAFMLNHFLLKALWHSPREMGFRRMVHEFWSSYQTTRSAPELEARTGPLLLMLLLARVDGKSPVEYLDSARQDFVRQFVNEALRRSDRGLRAVGDFWFDRLLHFGK